MTLLDIRVDGFDQSPNGTDFIEGFAAVLEFCAARTALPAESLDRVVVADESHFATAVFELQKAANCAPSLTATDLHSAVGKTIPSIGGRKSSVVVRDFVAMGALLALTSANGGDVSGSKALFRDGDAELFLYVVAHELAHCRDNCEREQSTSTFPSAEEGFRISRFAEYYWSVIVSEYSASYFSAPVMSPAAYTRALEEFTEDLVTIPEVLAGQRDDYRLRHRTLVDLARSVASGLWVLLTQAAKLIASSEANANLTAALPQLPERALEAVREMAAVLRNRVLSPTSVEAYADTAVRSPNYVTLFL